ncbi:myeloid-associated differentiation marker homolog [Alosa pseudoharengus]|uniref:myeloid-associated differentiation marker homolog n=1 Tax=Alosa pseudoharengus TaxID=34774 RepID=UPI003F8AC9D8
MVQHVDLRAVSQPLGILRVLEVALTLVSLALVASVGHLSSSYWAWCMFSWVFCCALTLLILVLEFSTLSARLPISWDDFTTAFAMLAALMLLAASIIYPSVVFSCPDCGRQVAATVVSWVSVAAYIGEVVLVRFFRRSGQVSGFLSTVPGLLKILETFVACIIFTSLVPERYASHAALQWCVAVYALCFIFALLIIVLTVGQLLTYIPFLDKLVCVYNVLAVVMYMSAVVVWPLYSFQKHPRPTNCTASSACLAWDALVVVTFMTVINLGVYILDAAYSIHLVFFVQRRS